MDLGLTVTNRGDHAILSLHGEVDLATAPRVRERMIQLVDAGERSIVVDLDGVAFLDSTGLGVLVGGLRRLRTLGGELKLACANRRILSVLEVTGLDRVFPTYASVDDAVAVAAQ